MRWLSLLLTLCVTAILLGQQDIDRLGRECEAGNPTSCATLAVIAVENRDSNTRKMAVERLADQSVIADIAKSDESPEVRMAAVQKLADQAALEQVARNDRVYLLRLTAVRKLTDQAVIAQIAKNDKHPLVREGAAKLIKDQNILAIASDSTHLTQLPPVTADSASVSITPLSDTTATMSSKVMPLEPNPNTTWPSTMGAGVGISYGLIGINADLITDKNTHFVAGIGYYSKNVCYNFGLKQYLSNPSHNLRLRLLTNFGIIAIAKVYSHVDFTAGHYIGGTYYSEHYSGLVSTGTKAIHGITIGLGGQYMFGSRKKHGFDFDVLYVVKEWASLFSAGKYEIKDETPIRICFGYRFAFKSR
jgi:hypothetical protein